MKIKPIYRYKRADGGITDSPVKPDGLEYTERVRLIADEGKMLTQDGESLMPVIDADNVDGWYEVDAPDETEEELAEAVEEVQNDEISVTDE